ncbi:MAG: ubiquinone/menaquinone biosynthesis methyltransferase [Chitinophagales bacterium]|jgi:ubiquinone/menaquinone biosynthesis methyltransferase
MPNANLIANKVLVPKEFNNVAAKYDFATYLSQGYHEDLDNSAKWLDLKGDERVLDLCCGTGKSTAACLPYIKTGSIIGIDNSEGMLEVANEKFATEIRAGKLSFELQDAMELNFPKESFDAIFMAYGLRNMPDYDKCLNQLYSLLKPGGKISIHDYSLANKSWARYYWGVLSYGFIVPFCTILSGSSKIYTYLAKSVLTFLTPNEVKTKMIDAKFKNVTIKAHKSWRSPILHAFIATK